MAQCHKCGIQISPQNVSRRTVFNGWSLGGFFSRRRSTLYPWVNFAVKSLCLTCAGHHDRLFTIRPNLVRNTIVVTLAIISIPFLTDLFVSEGEHPPAIVHEVPSLTNESVLDPATAKTGPEANAESFGGSRSTPVSGRDSVSNRGAPVYETDTATQPYVTTRDVLLRSGPGEQYAVVSPIPVGTKVNVTGKQGEWLRVVSKYGRPPGYIGGTFAIPLTESTTE